MKADDLTIREPCPEDWSAMRGDGPLRHCDACKHSVHNLSEMTKPEADALLGSRTGRLCVRYTINPGGGVRFRPEPTPPRGPPPAPALVQLRKRSPAEPRRAAALTRTAIAASILAACTPHIHHDSSNGCLESAIDELLEEREQMVMGLLVQEPQGVDPTLAPQEPDRAPRPPGRATLASPAHPARGHPPQDLEPPPPPVVDPFPELMGDIAALDRVHERPPAKMGEIKVSVDPIDQSVPCDIPSAPGHERSQGR